MARVLGSSEESMWIAIHIYMEAMLGISLYNISLSQTSKNMSFLSYLMFSLQQYHRTREWNKFCLAIGWGSDVAQTMYKHVSKCKNDKL
jgi:hypothetical protein